MQTIERFDFFPLTFDAQGKVESRQEFDAFVKRAASATDALFIAHGFRNDERDATGVYTRFLKTFRGHLSRPEFKTVAGRGFVVAGVYWPSKPFRETYAEEAAGTRGLQNPKEAMSAVKGQLDELSDGASPAQRAKLEKAAALLPALEANRKAQDEFVSLVLSLLDRSTLDRTEGLPQIRTQNGSELLARLSDAPASGTRGIGDVVGTLAGGVGKFLNLTKWYVMKDRSGTVGAEGVAPAVRALREKCPTVKIHLVGHSLGGRLMASCAKALGEAPRLQPDSLMLLEAAFSHYGFSADNGRGNAGFFRDVITRKVVKGPFLSTFSAQDTVVGKAYSIMSRLAGDNTREIGDASDEYGGIGRNGPLKTTEVVTGRLHAPGTAYKYKTDVINNLDGSGGLIKDHGDVTNDAITYAFASAVART
jgi:hypothetical protein